MRVDIFPSLGLLMVLKNRLKKRAGGVALNGQDNKIDVTLQEGRRRDHGIC